MGKPRRIRARSSEGMTKTLVALPTSLRRKLDAIRRREGLVLGECMRHVVEHFGSERRAAKVTYPTLEGYVRARRVQKAAAATVRFELAVLSQAFRVARKRGVLANSPLFPTVTVRNVRTEHFTDA